VSDETKVQWLSRTLKNFFKNIFFYQTSTSSALEHLFHALINHLAPVQLSQYHHHANPTSADELHSPQPHCAIYTSFLLIVVFVSIGNCTFFVPQTSDEMAKPHTVPTDTHSSSSLPNWMHKKP
jgi:hypothetical protein